MVFLFLFIEHDVVLFIRIDFFFENMVQNFILNFSLWKYWNNGNFQKNVTFIFTNKCEKLLK